MFSFIWTLVIEQVLGNTDVLMVSKTKIEDSFPIWSFLIHAFSPLYSLDYDSKDDGIMLYIWEDIHWNLLTTDNDHIESLYAQLNLRNEKYLINCLIILITRW